MSFVNLSPLAFAAGLLAIAGILYLLQQLRTRFNEVTVATTMFWAEAVRDAPVRVLRQRFRHLLAYLLALLIAWLLWLGFADPDRSESSTTSYYVLFLDGSAGSVAGDEFDRSKERLTRYVSGLPRDNREVVFGGSHTVQLLAPGEDAAILERRLNTVSPQPAPTSLGRYLETLSVDALLPREVNVVVFGRAGLRRETLQNLRRGFKLTYETDDFSELPNHGITALGVDLASSNHWEMVDAFLRIGSSNGSVLESDELTVSIGGEELLNASIETIGINEFVIRDLPADGSTLEVKLPDDPLPFDNVSKVALPERKLIRVVLGVDVDATVRNAVRADYGLQVVSDAPDVVIHSGNLVSPGTPSLTLISMAEQEHAFEIGYLTGVDPEQQLHRSVEALGLRHIDHTAIATAFDQPITADVFPSERRKVSIWSELVEDRFNFVGSVQFPMFLSRTVRWLVGEDPWFEYVAAGRPVDLTRPRSPLLGASELADLSLGADFVKGSVGAVALPNGLTLQVSLLDDAVTTMKSPIYTEGASEDEQPILAWNWISLLGLVALVLLAVEWYLYQRGLIP